MITPKVLFLPGSVLPAQLAYGSLLAELGRDVDAVAKELEVYSGAHPPTDYSLDNEVDGVLREADGRGWDRFHLVGYSGGGASALAFTARFPDRLLSLALLEPAWAGNWVDISDAHRAFWATIATLDAVPPGEFMSAFMRLNVRPEVELSPPPAGDPPPWMALRPAGMRAFITTFGTYDLDRDALRRFSRPVYFALGGLSNPDEYGEIAERLATVFADFTLEVFEDRHHFDPPHRAEPERLARSLRTLWARGTTAV